MIPVATFLLEKLLPQNNRLGFSFAMVVCVILSSALPVRAWVVEYGSGSAELSYYNYRVNPQIEGPSLGPMSFRVFHGNLFVADSIGGRIIGFAPGGEKIFELKLPDHPENVLIEDFAVVGMGLADPSLSFWVAEGAECTVKRINRAGIELLTLRPEEDESENFVQISRLETGPSGNVFVGDLGVGRIFVFSEHGELLRSHNWVGSGFHVDNEDRLSLIGYSDSAGHFWQLYSASGHLEKLVHLGSPELANPFLHSVVETGPLVSFVPEPGFRGLLELVFFDFSGGVLVRSRIKPVREMNRFIEASGSLGWIADGDFSKAPEGSFSVRPLQLPEARR